MDIDWDQPLPRDELRPFLAKSNVAGLRLLAFNWVLIVACFLLVMWHASGLTVAIAMLVLGGRQLGLGILMHDAAHRSLMKSPAMNEWIGQWLCAAPIFADLPIYRRYHMTHHMKAGTDEDPDLANYVNYPVSKASLGRKFLRDLTGQSGMRAFTALVALYGTADLGQQKHGYSYRVADGMGRWHVLLRHSWRSIAANAVMAVLCVSAGHALVYLLWPASWMTTYMLFSRVRNAAEHGALAGTRDPNIWCNTRTVLARWWERLTVAPNYVNYHFEHHLVPTVPAYQLPRFHRWLHAHRAYELATLERGYSHVMRRLVRTNC
jgi:fatty acid desaturase